MCRCNAGHIPMCMFYNNSILFFYSCFPASHENVWRTNCWEIPSKASPTLAKFDFALSKWVIASAMYMFISSGRHQKYLLQLHITPSNHQNLAKVNRMQKENWALIANNLRTFFTITMSFKSKKQLKNPSPFHTYVDDNDNNIETVDGGSFTTIQHSMILKTIL